jgi:hypothetical protein
LVSINMVTPSRTEKPVPGAIGSEQRTVGLEQGAVGLEQGSLVSEQGHGSLPQQVLEDVMCSFIRGIEAAESLRLN